MMTVTILTKTLTMSYLTTKKELAVLPHPCKSQSGVLHVLTIPEIGVIIITIITIMLSSSFNYIVFINNSIVIPQSSSSSQSVQGKELCSIAYSSAPPLGHLFGYLLISVGPLRPCRAIFTHKAIHLFLLDHCTKTLHSAGLFHFTIVRQFTYLVIHLFLLGQLLLCRECNVNCEHLFTYFRYTITELPIQ